MAAPLSRLIPGIVGEAFRRRGFVEPVLATGWRDIVGEDTARHAIPVRIEFPRGSRSGGTLHIRVEGAHAPDLQHNAPRIVERINSFHGYAAVARLALHQGPVQTRTAARASREPAGREAPEIGGVKDPRLREALRGLGTTIRDDSE